VAVAHCARLRQCSGMFPDRELGGRPPAFDDVGDSARDQDEDEQRQKPGPPAVSCEQHSNLRCWVRPITERPILQYLPREGEKGRLSPGSVRECRPSAPAIRNFGKIRAMRVTYASEGGFRQWAS
jgi:hypothetical protein